MIDSFMVTASRYLLGMTGVGTMALGVVTPIDSVWPKMVAVLGGLVALMVSVMFTGFIRHISSHSKEVENIVDKSIRIRSQLCTAEFKESIREVLVSILKEHIKSEGMKNESDK